MAGKDDTNCSQDQEGFGIDFNINQTDDNGFAGTIKVVGETADLLQRVASGPKTINLDRSVTKPTEDQPLWSAIRNRTNAINFNKYNDFIYRVLCENWDDSDDRGQDVRSNHGSPSIIDKKSNLLDRPTIYGSDSYKLLKLATEAFLISNVGFS